MIPRQRGFPGLRLDNGNAMPLGECRERLRRAGKMHPAAGDNDRVLRRLDRRDCGFELGRVRLRPALSPDLLLKQRLGKIKGFGLHVLA